MYHPTTRLLTVLELLQTHGRLSGAELAERLEVDGRSVRRYITMLQDLGIPVVSERGRHGGYRLRPGYKLPPLMFTDEEALAVTLGLLAARQLGLAAAAPAVEGALAKLDRVLPAAVRAAAQAVQETVAFDLPAFGEPPADGAVRAFSAGASQGRRVWLRYQDWRGGASERTVDPYGLVYRLGAWYAVGWCHLRADLRVFRLDRVERVALLNDAFTPPADFDCRAYVQQALATAPYGWTVEVLLETTLAEARQWLPPVVGTLDAVPGGVLLRCQASRLDRVAQHLVGLPWPAVVQQPPELIDALRGAADRLARCIERSLASSPKANEAPALAVAGVPSGQGAAWGDAD